MYLLTIFDNKADTLDRIIIFNLDASYVLSKSAYMQLCSYSDKHVIAILTNNNVLSTAGYTIGAHTCA